MGYGRSEARVAISGGYWVGFRGIRMGCNPGVGDVFISFEVLDRKELVGSLGGSV